MVDVVSIASYISERYRKEYGDASMRWSCTSCIISPNASASFRQGIRSSSSHYHDLLMRICCIWVNGNDIYVLCNREKELQLIQLFL